MCLCCPLPPLFMYFTSGNLDQQNILSSVVQKKGDRSFQLQAVPVVKSTPCAFSYQAHNNGQNTMRLAKPRSDDSWINKP